MLGIPTTVAPTERVLTLMDHLLVLASLVMMEMELIAQVLISFVYNQ